MEKNLATPVEAAAIREKLGYIDEQQLFSLFHIKPGTGRNRQSAGSRSAARHDGGTGLPANLVQNA